MAGIASKNRFELLPDDDTEEEAKPSNPTAVDKPVARSGKRNPGADAPAGGSGAARGGRGGRQNGHAENEQGAGSGGYRDRNRAPDDNQRSDRHPDRLKDRGTGIRGGRGSGRVGRTHRDDRHSRTGVASSNHEKQVAQGWGGKSGAAEWSDEKSGEAQAQEDAKAGENDPLSVSAPAFDPNEGQREGGGDGDGGWGGGADSGEGATGATADGDAAAAAAAAAEPELEDKTKSYETYLAEQAEKRLNLGVLTARKPNEGDGTKKFPEGKPLSKGDAETADFIAGSGGKARRERTGRKEKTLVELDDARLRDQPAEGGDGRRGSFRGGRGRGRGDGGGRDRDRDGGHRDGGQRDGGHRDGGHRDGGPREGGQGGEGGGASRRGDRQGDRDRGGDSGGGRGRGRGRGRGGHGAESEGHHRPGQHRGRGSGGGGGHSQLPNVGDTNAFPSLGQ